MDYSDKHPDTLADIALYAGYADDAIRQAQETIRKLAGFLGPVDGAFLIAAADMLGDAIHDELDPHKRLALEAIASGAPQAGVTAYHREMAVCLREAGL